MDAKELLQREQVSLVNAANATCTESRRAHEGLARAYGDRLRGFPSMPARGQRRPKMKGIGASQ